MTFYPRPRTREEAADRITRSQVNYARDGYGLTWRGLAGWTRSSH